MLNKWIGIGRLTKTPDLRYTPNGNATCNFTLACDRQFKNAQGEKETDFLPIVVPPFRAKLAELCSNYLDKGKLAAVVGSVQTRNFEGQDGKKVYVTEIIAEEVKFLSPKDNTQGQPANTASGTTYGHEVSLDDDIPF